MRSTVRKVGGTPDELAWYHQSAHGERMITRSDDLDGCLPVGVRDVSRSVREIIERAGGGTVGTVEHVRVMPVGAG